MKLIGDITFNIIYEMLAKKYSREYATIVLNWKKIVGIDFFHKSYPQKLIYSKNLSSYNEATLYVKAYDSITSLELNFQRDIIIERISIYLGYKFIKNIVINLSLNKRT